MTWPPVFDGIGALFVGADNDPDVQAERIPGLTWVALKVNGADASPLDEQLHWVERMRARGITVGSWVYCFGPPNEDSADVLAAWKPSLLVYDVEAEYKTDEAGPDVAGWPAALVKYTPRSLPVAVTSYGAYKVSIDFGAFAAAGWPILAQCYDPFEPGDESSYWIVRGGPYPAAGVHQLNRSLSLRAGQAVYRPESIDG